jgi:anti-sigma B factor antagonist
VSDAIDVTEHTGWTVLTVAGELDVVSGPSLADLVTKQLPDRRDLVIDLSEVSFVDSSGLGVLVRALKQTREAGGQLTLVIRSEQTLKLFSITGLDRAFIITNDVTTATSEPPPQ